MNGRLRRLDIAIAAERPDTAGWREVARDPNAAAALAYRARTLRAAWSKPISDRAECIIERCRGRRALDIGCVAHDMERMSSRDWLHRRIAQAAACGSTMTPFRGSISPLDAGHTPGSAP